LVVSGSLSFVVYRSCPVCLFRFFAPRTRTAAQRGKGEEEEADRESRAKAATPAAQKKKKLHEKKHCKQKTANSRNKPQNGQADKGEEKPEKRFSSGALFRTFPRLNGVSVSVGAIVIVIATPLVVVIGATKRARERAKRRKLTEERGREKTHCRKCNFSLIFLNEFFYVQCLAV